MPMPDIRQPDSPLYNLSDDYERLHALICEGHRIAAWADTFSMADEHGKPYRDICEVRKFRAFEIMISCRGTSYGNVFPFMAENGTEREVFVRMCRGCNLRWISPGPEETSTVACM